MMTQSDTGSSKSGPGMSEEGIDFSDIPETSAEFWKDAVVVQPEDRAAGLWLRVDPQVLAWFRSRGDTETQINAVLRKHVEAQTDKK